MSADVVVSYIFGITAALSWNEAINKAIQTKTGNLSVFQSFLVAIFVTIVIVVLAIGYGKLRGINTTKELTNVEKAASLVIS